MLSNIEMRDTIASQRIEREPKSGRKKTDEITQLNKYQSSK